ncbi:diguanylate cyclase (GGDEF) domain-containing protein [Butyrivibrio sp. Su6]|uniref:sensor domain-containing diguanylate cyclase n=1 Tax=Butyrivibrio sp. Su6 TaxID=1520810 RepID=UPI00089E6C21|nr:diguanylate cyclase [Butyrivibrio sp. Su6]SEG41631.1 diguanylate cyclase (GGDEF) domain-containing protein [Butyrivibrio sp. Su6]
MLNKKKIIRIIPFFFWPVVILVAFFWVYSNYENLYLKNIEYRGAKTTSYIADSFLTYLGNIDNTLKSCASSAEYMMAKGASEEEIRDYLVYESENLGITTKTGSRGVFGVFNGRFLDGVNWNPDSSYDATGRLWYTEAVKNAGRYVFVGPYYNLRTQDYVVTVSKLLDDGESVIAYAIDYATFKDMTTKLIGKDETRTVLIMDDSGVVICNSRDDEMGVDYATSEDLCQREIYKAWRNNRGKSTYQLRSDGWNDDDFIVSQRHLLYNLNVLTITDANAEMDELKKTASLLGAVLFLALVISFVLNQRKYHKDHESFINARDLNAVANIYGTIVRIDLDKDELEIIFCRDYSIASSLEEGRHHARETVAEFTGKFVADRSYEMMKEFMDFSSLNDRLTGKQTLTLEFLNYDHIWYRGRFIVAERDQDEKVTSVIFATETIDEEKRIRDKYQYLAETDQLTGINNRGSGEGKIRDLLQKNVGGMFFLFDVDKFKLVNDNFGHDVGDEVLVGIAERMKRLFREKDIVMRLGGDEYAAYMPGVFSKEDGELIMKRLIDSIHDMDIEKLQGRQIDISVGAAIYYPTDSYSFGELYKRADNCAYESKKIPGSAVTFYERDDEESTRK